MIQVTEIIENWKIVDGTGGMYEVSDQGRVRSHFGRGGPRILKQFGNTAGYPCVTMRRFGKKRSAMEVYRLVMDAFVGPLPAGMDTRHLNGDRADSALANLAYGTRLENSLDRVAHGNAGILKKEDVESLRLGRETARQVAERVGVHPVTCTMARSGERWIHMSDPPPWPKRMTIQQFRRRGGDLSL